MRPTTVALVLPLIALSVGSGAALADQDSPPSTFDSVSLRQSATGGRGALIRIEPSGRLIMTRVPLRQIIHFAFGVQESVARFTIVGGPQALLSREFDIIAVSPPVASQTQIPLMVRALLAQRFRLRTSTEDRQVPVYALTAAHVGQVGLRLRRSVHNCKAYVAARRAGPSLATPQDTSGRPLCTGGYDFAAPGTVTVRGAGELSDLLGLTQGFLDRLVVDRTKLTGNFEWAVTFSRTPLTPASDAPAPAIFTAFEEQLGLKLQPTRIPVPVMVIESVETPADDW